MPYFLYEATDSGGKTSTGFQDAATVQAAHVALMHAGHRDIRILDSQTSADLQDAHWRAMPEEERREHAKTLMRYRRADDFRSELRQSMRAQVWDAMAQNRGVHVVFGAVLLYCLWQGVWLGVAGVLILYGVPALRIWQLHRWWDLKHELETARVLAEWDKALSLIARLRANKDMCEEPDADLDFQEAAIRARQGGDVDRIIAGLSPWRERLADKAGAFEARVLQIYLAGGRFDRYLEAARQSLDAVPEDPTRRIDLALAEARYGRVAEARAVLDTVDVRLLSEGMLTCSQWIEGVIALRSGDNARALVELDKAMATVRAKVSQSARARVLLAEMTGAYSLALVRSGRKEEAARTLAEAWPLLQLHASLGFDGMMTLLRQEVGAPA
ncbi:MAG: hypothetical protein Q7T36_11095 [Fluviicoccus sp.]|uniref:hypothetical protein n=1 Tax=Fluviicoccus sp. TaxID=2003552 RepID=UPI002724CD68|nr:hypothetical protein [Fluviicoccus sp.]MDO8331003.1 hypothetical protein [Fluviicoccus sp.]